MSKLSKIRRKWCVVEDLEIRQLLSLTVDVRVVGGSHSAAATSVGQVIKMEAWATVTGADGNPNNDGLQTVNGSFLSSDVSGGSVSGTLKATRAAPFTGMGSADGTQQDLDGDGDLDVGSNLDSSAYNFFYDRANTMQLTGGTTSGNSHSFKIADLTFTVTGLRSGSETDIVFRQRQPKPGIIGSYPTALWEQDGVIQTTQGASSNSSKGYFVGGGVALTRSGTGGGGGGGGVQVGSISGNVWKDTNSNGFKDSGEANFPGFELYIDSNFNGLLDGGERTAFTDGNGNYSFSNLPGNASYRVRANPPSGWGTTAANGSTKWWDVSLGSGTNATGKNFGEHQTGGSTGGGNGSIAGNVWKDTNSNGFKDSGEANFSGFELYIDSNFNGLLDGGERTAFTDSNGNYSFSNLPGNANYRVRANPPAGWGTSAANGSTKWWDVFLSSGQNATGKNFGEHPTSGSGVANGSISGNVWKDTNSNGFKDSGEANFPGFELYIDSNFNGILDGGERTTFTDGNGNYTFSNLPGNASYRVRAMPPSGWGTSAANGSTKWWDVSLGSGTNATGKNFGEHPTSGSTGSGSISGLVWEDTNSNGFKDSNESAFSGFELYIDSNFNGILDGGERTTFTDGNGNYSFSNLSGNANYRVRAMPPSGWGTNVANGSTKWWDVFVGSGQNVTGKNFGEHNV